MIQLQSTSLRCVPPRLVSTMDAFLKSLRLPVPENFQIEAGEAGISLNGTLVAPRNAFSSAAKRLWQILSSTDGRERLPRPAGWGQAALRQQEVSTPPVGFRAGVGKITTATNAVKDAHSLFKIACVPVQIPLLSTVHLASHLAKVQTSVDEQVRAQEIGDGVGLFRARHRIAAGTYGALANIGITALTLEWLGKQASRLATCARIALGSVGVALTSVSVLWETFRVTRALEFRSQFHERLHSPFLSEREQLMETLQFLRDQLVLTPLERVEAGEDPAAQSKRLQEKWATFSRHSGVSGDIGAIVDQVEALLDAPDPIEIRAFLLDFSQKNHAHVVNRVAIIASLALGLAAAAIAIVLTGGLSIPILMGISGLLSIVTGWEFLMSPIASLCWKIRGNRL